MRTLKSSVVWVCLICCWSPAAGQHVVDGFIGGQVVLPCSTDVLSTFSVFWRDKNDDSVLDFTQDGESPPSPKFKGRVSSYPKEYRNGNYSILLRNLTADDDGMYTCHIPSKGFVSEVTLRVTEKLTTTPPTTTTTTTRSAGGAAVTASLHPALLLALLILLLS